MSSTNPHFWDDERGFVISAEFTLISTVLIISLVVGFNGLSTSLTEELATMANSPQATIPVERYSTLGLDQPTSSSQDSTSDSLPGESAAG